MLGGQVKSDIDTPVFPYEMYIRRKNLIHFIATAKDIVK